MQSSDVEKPAGPGAPRLEVAHVLFIDVVGFGRLPMSVQAAVQVEIQSLVQNTEVVRQTRAAHEVIMRPTGDGMALVFLKDMLSPIRCALELDETLKADSTAIRQRTGTQIQMRMGIHTGPVMLVEDINLQSDAAGEGIIMAQRVMDCGDGGHILLSEDFAHVLAKVDPWSRYLNDIGICWVKHGVPVHLFNLYGRRNGLRGSHTFGNGNRPEKALRDNATTDSIDREIHLKRIRAVSIPIIALLALAILGFGLTKVPAKTYKAIGGWWQTQVMARLNPKPEKPGKTTTAKTGMWKPTKRSESTAGSGNGSAASVPVVHTDNGDTGGTSTKSNRIEVPDLKSISYDDAVVTLGDRPLKLEKSRESDYSTDYSEGMIYYQKPAAGKMVKPNTIIYVRVSKGDPPQPVEKTDDTDTGSGNTTGDPAKQNP